MTRHQQNIQAATAHCAILAKKYKVEICSYDKTALIVFCTEEELSLICRQLKCSGIYSQKTNSGIITNFGVYV